MPRIFGGPGIFPTNSAVPGNGNELVLQAGATWTIPAGNFVLTSVLGLLSLQEYDAITNTWRPVGGTPVIGDFVRSEGNNFRIANQSGCAVGGFVTAKGSGYTSAPSVVPTAGASKWAAIIGGAVTSVAVTNGGSGYIYPPLVFFDAPAGTANAGIVTTAGQNAQPGFPATATATLTAGAVSSITVTDQGAGFASIPNVYLINDPRDATGSGATAAAVIGGAGQLTGVVCIDHGNAVTSLPTLTISGGGGSAGAATVVANFAVTGITVSGGGTGFATSSSALIQPLPPALAAAAWTNPTMETNLVLQRLANLIIPTTGGGALTATGAAGFGGAYAAAPTAAAIAGSTLITGSPTVTFAVGGITDTLIVTQI
jgi:hypothetical protein